jgi:hypothetical protein
VPDACRLVHSRQTRLSLGSQAFPAACGRRKGRVSLMGCDTNMSFPYRRKSVASRRGCEAGKAESSRPSARPPLLASAGRSRRRP